jgi:hypothetical protein
MYNYNGGKQLHGWHAGMQGTEQASAKNISVWVEWLHQSGHALRSEPSGTPWWQITLRLVSILRVALHIAPQSPFRRFFSLCRSSILNKHSGIVANCNHMSEWFY